MRMLLSPSRSPGSASKRLPGGTHRSSNRLHRIRKIKRIMLPLPGLDQCDKHVKAIALRRVALCGHRALDLLEGVAVVTLGLDYSAPPHLKWVRSAKLLFYWCSRAPVHNGCRQQRARIA